MEINKPYSQACENNKAPIFEHLQRLLSGHKNLLEIGSGTGQHAVYFAERLPQLCWNTSDLKEHHGGINLWLDEYAGNNIKRPLEFNVDGQWPELSVDALYTANTLHIMGWSSVENFFAGLPKILGANGKLIVYGPFNYNGEFTSESNASFDVWLKDRNPVSGIRDFEAVNKLAEQAGLRLLEDSPMPANNRLLVWQL